MSKATLYQGDSIEAMSLIESDSIDTIITDPPAGIYFMGKKWDDLRAYEVRTARGKEIAVAVNALVDAGALESWEAGFLLFTVDWANEALRVARPGASALVWAIPRTLDLTQIGLRMAGFRIVDSISHIYASGFPKSLAIGKAIDRSAGEEREVIGVKPGHENFIGRETHPLNDGWDRPWARDKESVDRYHSLTAPVTDEAKLWEGWGTALKPAREDWILAVKPITTTYAKNAIEHGVAGLWVDGGRIPTSDNTACHNKGVRFNGSHYAGGTVYEPKEPWISGGHSGGRWPSNFTMSHHSDCVQIGTRKIKGHSGYPNGPGGKSMHYSDQESRGQDVRPGAWDGHADDDGLEEVETWDCHEECPVRMIGEQTGKSDGELGTVSRFFYCSKPQRAEKWFYCSICREAHPVTERGDHLHKDATSGLGHIATHPTQKPLGFMRYLCRITRTPTGGVILDPFMGSGSTGVAAVLEGRDFIGIDRGEEYVAVANSRIRKAIDETEKERYRIAMTDSGVPVVDSENCIVLFGNEEDAKRAAGPLGTAGFEPEWRLKQLCILKKINMPRAMETETEISSPRQLEMGI